MHTIIYIEKQLLHVMNSKDNLTKIELRLSCPRGHINVAPQQIERLETALFELTSKVKFLKIQLHQIPTVKNKAFIASCTKKSTDLNKHAKIEIKNFKKAMDMGMYPVAAKYYLAIDTLTGDVYDVIEKIMDYLDNVFR